MKLPQSWFGILAGVMRCLAAGIAFGLVQKTCSPVNYTTSKADRGDRSQVLDGKESSRC